MRSGKPLPPTCCACPAASRSMTSGFTGSSPRATAGSSISDRIRSAVSSSKDQLLASYYTRDLLATERLFLLSVPARTPRLETRDFSHASIRTAGSANPQFPIDSLRGLGMSDLQIEEIQQTRTAAPNVNIYSPVTGFVLARNISPGQRFDKGTEFYRIADISHVWVMTDIFEKDREFVKPGAMATDSLSGPRVSGAA